MIENISFTHSFLSHSFLPNASNSRVVNLPVRPDERAFTSRMPRPRESSARRLLPTCTASNSSGKRCPDSMMPTSSCSRFACSPGRNRLSARAPAPSHVIGCRRLADRVRKRKQCHLLSYCAALQQFWGTQLLRLPKPAVPAQPCSLSLFLDGLQAATS